MKTLGLIGGMSWNSTELYYRALNQKIAAKKGGLHSAKLFMYSFDFAEIAALQKIEDWAGATALMDAAAVKLKLAGVDAFVICSNTMHRMAPDIETATGLPVLHITDALAETMAKSNITKAGILGTYYTMSAEFYADYFKQHHGITLIAPEEASKREVHRVIYEELCQGEVKDSSRTRLIEIIRALHAQGAQAIILGCTELCMLLKSHDYSDIPLLDSTEIHAEYATQFALK